MAKSYSDNVEMKRFNCEEPCKSVKNCASLPLELHRFKKSLDILFLTEFPGKNETMGKRFLDSNSRQGGPFRRIIQVIEKMYGSDWSYGIAGLFKATSSFDSLDIKSMKHCQNQVLTREIKFCNPKVIVAFGEKAFEFIFGKKPRFGMLCEDSKLYKNVEVLGEKRDIFCSMNPAWHTRQADDCSLGPLFEIIRRSVDYSLNNVDFLIPDTFETELVTDFDQLKAILKKIRKHPDIVGVDTETNNLNRVYENKILSLQLSCDGKLGYVIPIDHYESPFKDNDRVKKLLYNFFTKPGANTKGYVFVNAKFDLHQMFREFHTLEYNAPILDCSFAEYSLDENWTRLHGFPDQKGQFSLFTMAYKRGFNYYADSDSKEMRAQLSHLPLDKWTQYGGADVVVPWQIFKSQELQASRTNYAESFKKMNYIFFGHLIRSCLYVEHCGLSIDRKVLDFLHSPKGPFKQIEKEIMDGFFECETVKRVNDKLCKEKVGNAGSGLFGATRIFNPSRPPHREALFFEEMQLSPVEDDEDDTGTTGKEFQKHYRDSYKEVDLLAQFNASSKIKTTFVDPVYTWMKPNSKERHPDFYTDERVRGTFTYMAVTGRLKCYRPNCYSLDSYININGKLMTFQELIDKEDLRHNDNVALNIDTPTGVRKTKKFYRYTNQQVLEITLETNHKIKCTYENNCYILDKDGIIKVRQAQDLKVGDYFLLTGGMTFPKENEKFNIDVDYLNSINKSEHQITWPEKMTPELATILGYLCSDGSSDKIRFGQYDGNRRIFDYFQECWQKIFGFKRRHQEGMMITVNGNQTYFYSVDYNIKAIYEFFNSIGYYQGVLKSHTMEIPWSIMQADKECVRAFIRAYVDGDGWFANGISRMCICTTSNKILEQMGQLLLKFGIVAYLRNNMKAPDARLKHYLHYLDVSGYMFDRYMYKIGFGKKSIDEPVLSSMKNGGNLCRIPNVIPNISKNLEQDMLCRKSGSNNLNVRRITEPFMEGLKKENIKVYKCLDYIISTGATPVKIKSINKCAPETVVDFTVEEDRNQIPPFRRGNLIVNGIVILNSQQRPSRGAYTKTILSMYSPKRGRAVVKLDYVTFEVKGLGFMSEDEAMVKSFNEMHDLKLQYRENPECFFKQGYEIEKKALLGKKKALEEDKAKLEVLKEVSKKDYLEASEKYKENLIKYKEEKAKLLDKKENNKISLSHDYLVFQTDFHRRSAALFNKCAIEEVKKDMRQNAKGLVFGCKIYTTIVSTKHGPYRLGDLVGKEGLKVQSLNRSIKVSDGAVYQGKKPVVRVLTRRAGLIGTSGHHIMVFTNEAKLKMVPLAELQKGDVVIFQKGILGDTIPRVGGKKITIEDAEAMGLFTGDGFAGRGKNKKGNGEYYLEYTSVDRDEMMRFARFIQKISGKEGHFKLGYKNTGSFAMSGSVTQPLNNFSLSDKDTWEKLNEFGLLGRQEVRRVPAQILRAKPDYICAYLRGYFDADGGIRKSSRCYKQLFLSSLNAELLYDVVYLLYMLGITSRVFRNHHPGFELIITNYNSMKKFCELIGFGTSRKQQELEEYIEFIDSNITRKAAIDKTNYPIDVKALNKKYQQRAGVNTFRSRKVEINGVVIKPLKKPLQYVLDHIDEYKESFIALDMKEEWKGLKLISNKDILLSEVFETAQPYGKEKEKVYDIINVDKYNKWCANGVIVSNSIYGRGIDSIAKELKIETKVAQEYFDLFMGNMPQAGQWLEDQKVFGKENLYVESPLGRRRRLWGYLFGNKSKDSKMDRLADNSGIQGICSDCNLIATSMLMTLISKHGKAKYQIEDDKAWLLTNLVHDSCEMEVPVEDVYYCLKTFEALYTDLLMQYIKRSFKYNIKVPLEVDFTVAPNYANTEDWDGSDIHARKLQKWILEECGKRDNKDYSNLYKKAIKNPMFDEFPNIAQEVVDEWVNNRDWVLD